MSAVSKKSFSSVSSPILACIRVTSTLPCCSTFSSPKTLAAPSCIRVFQSVIWLGWTSNCWASSARVLSPFRAAKATFALPAAVWFRRGRRVIVAPRFCHLNGRQGTTFPLIPLSESPDPAYSPVQYSATAVADSCPQGIASMGIYVNNQLIYVVNGTQMNAQVAMNTGPEHTVVEEWDYCGGAAYTTRDITVEASGTPAVSSPASGATVTSPVQYSATAVADSCPQGIASMGIY